MLCAGVIDGDLSEYSILVGEGGPVIIDLSQAVDAAEMFGRGESPTGCQAGAAPWFARLKPV